MSYRIPLNQSYRYNGLQMGETGENTWPENKTSALSLSFDGGLPEHWELIAPLLEENGLRGSFFVTVPALLGNPESWRKLVYRGHEIGSHSHLGITDNGNLPAWTLEMVREDLRMTDKGIVEILGCPVTSFARSGLECAASDGDYRSVLSKLFSFIRTSRETTNLVENVDMMDIASFSWTDLLGPIESVLPKQGEWSVISFEGFFDPAYVAAEDDLRVLLGHLVKREDIWVAPLSEVGSAILSKKGAIA